MKHYAVFLKKEIIEGFRTYKSYILIAVFLIFGITSPLLAKLTPELLASLAGDGISISIPEPSALDSWLQFFKNISQMGLVVLVILYSGILAQEISKGTLINVLTKGLSRTSVIFAKHSALVVLWTLAYALCFLLCFAYTAFLFPESKLDNLLFAIFSLWFFGLFLLSFLMLAASLSKSNYSCLLMTGLLIALLMMFNIIPAAHNYNPLSLAGDSTALMTGSITPGDLLPAVLIAAIASIVCLAGAVLVFRKRQL